MSASVDCQEFAKRIRVIRVPYGVDSFRWAVENWLSTQYDPDTGTTTERWKRIEQFIPDEHSGAMKCAERYL